MPITIRNHEVEQLAREVAREQQTSLTSAIHSALKLYLAQMQGKRREPSLQQSLLQISARCAALPDIDPRSADEILGYDKHGLPCHGG